jgi:anaerobic selenocysteine-containing dehydrogenase
VTELQFQRPQPELELSADDARRRRISTGDLVTVGSNESAITLPARVNRRLRAGVARVALEHANGLGGIVEVEKAEEVVSA